MTANTITVMPDDVAFIKVNNQWWALRDHKWIPVAGNESNRCPMDHPKTDPYELQISEAIAAAQKRA